MSSSAKLHKIKSTVDCAILCCTCAGMHRCKVYSTHVLTENCMVCRSQRIDVGAWVGDGPEAADAPDVLVVDPILDIWIVFN